MKKTRADEASSEALEEALALVEGTGWLASGRSLTGGASSPVYGGGGAVEGTGFETLMTGNIKPQYSYAGPTPMSQPGIVVDTASAAEGRRGGPYSTPTGFVPDAGPGRAKPAIDLSKYRLQDTGLEAELKSLREPQVPRVPQPSIYGPPGVPRLAEGGIVQGPTMAMLGEEEPEFIVPFSKVDEFRRGHLPLGKPRQSQTGGTVANFTDSMPRFANGGMVTGPRFGGVTGADLTPYGTSGAFVTPGTRKELDLGAEGQYGADGISRAPRIASTDFESLVKQYTQPPTGQEAFFQEFQGTTPRAANLANIPEYELRQRLGASEFAGTNPTQHPIGIQQLMAGRPIARPRSLMTAANMPKPSGQALRNMLPSETAYYQKMGRMAGIPQEELEREMRSVMPGGTRRTPLRMGARRVRQA